MQFVVGLLILSLLFVIFLLLGFFLLFRRSWLLVWLRANLGFFCLFIGLSGAAGLVVLADMQSVDGALNIGTAEIDQVSTSSRLSMKYTLSGEQIIELTQPEWRLRALHVKWSGFLTSLGVQNGVLLYDVQQGRNATVNSSTALEQRAVVKVWELGRTYLQWLPMVSFELLATDWVASDLETTYNVKMTSRELSMIDVNRKTRPNTAQALLEESDTTNGATESTTESIRQDTPATQENAVENDAIKEAIETRH